MKKKSLLSFILIFIVINSILIERIISQQNYSLFDLRHELIVKKRMLEMYAMGSDSFLLNRSSLAQGALHLNRWFGYQEINYKYPMNIKSIILNGKIDSGSELIVFWRKNNFGHEGIKIMKNGATFFFLATYNGKYVKKDNLDFHQTKDEYKIEIDFDENNTKINFNNGENIQKIDASVGEGYWGVRGGERHVSVDSLVVRDRAGNIYRQNFLPPMNFIVYMLLICFGGGMLFILKEKDQLMKRMLDFNIILFILLVALFVIDRHLWSHDEVDSFTHRIDSEKGIMPKIRSESVRHKFFSYFRLESVNKENVLDTYPGNIITRGPIFCQQKRPCVGLPRNSQIMSDVLQDHVRIMLVGSSQSIGIGASEISKTFFSVFHHLLDQSSNRKISSLNISIAGADAKVMLEEFLKHYKIFNPQIVLINLGHNGYTGENNAIVNAIEKIVDHTHQIKGKPILIKEAVANIDQRTYLHRIHLKLEKLALIKKIKVIDLHGYLLENQRKENGEIWWDIVHMTDYGQELAGKYIAGFLLPIKM